MHEGDQQRDGLFDRLLKRAQMPRVDAEGRKVGIHSLRHTFGSRLARHGVRLVQVQRLMATATRS